MTDVQKHLQIKLWLSNPSSWSKKKADATRGGGEKVYNARLKKLKKSCKNEEPFLGKRNEEMEKVFMISTCELFILFAKLKWDKNKDIS